MKRRRKIDDDGCTNPCRCVEDHWRYSDEIDAIVDGVEFATPDEVEDLRVAGFVVLSCIAHRHPDLELRKQAKQVMGHKVFADLVERERIRRQ